MIRPFHIGLQDAIVAMLLAEFVVAPFSTLAHELGHAIVALRSAPGKVTVVVGRKSAALGIVFDRLAIWWSPVPARGVRFLGVCIWNRRWASPRRRFFVSLAGPAVTLGLIPVYVVATILTAKMSVWVPATFGFSAFACFVSCLVNLDPRRTPDEVESSIRRDGPQALAAFRAMRRS